MAERVEETWSVDRNADPVRVYVPHPESRLSQEIDRGSAIVGVPASPEATLIYYEGNRFGAVNLQTFRDRVAHADGRLHAAYPTIATQVVDDRELFSVGWWHRSEGRLQLDVDEATITWWVDRADLSDDG